MNQIMQLKIYRTGSLWAFDDENTGLAAEPFVAGIEKIIDKIVDDPKQQTAELLFSRDPFPGTNNVLDRGRKDMGGVWYTWKKENMVGWLCPALFKYFDVAPKSIYVRIKNY